MSYYPMSYAMTNPGTPGWQFAPVPGWGMNPAVAGPARVGVGRFRGFGVDEPRVATDVTGTYQQTSWGMVAAVAAGALLTGVFLGFIAGKRSQRKMTANRRRRQTMRRNGRGARRSLTPNVRWSRKYKNQLPDSHFLYVGPGRKVRTTRGTFTIPKSSRKLPYVNLQGKIDQKHLANAISRLGQAKTKVPHKRKLQAKAQRLYAREFGYARAPRGRALPRAA